MIPETKKPFPEVAKYFSNLKDPRVERTRLHSLIDIIVIAILTVICGGEGWDEMEEFGESKLAWLKTFLVLENGIPSADTFRRVFSALDHREFEACFRSWVGALLATLGEQGELKGKVVAIDGKTVRGSFDRANEKSPLHLVHAFAAESGLLLGQLATAEKSNEITALLHLVKMLEISRANVTITAMGCQKEIAKQIVEQGADYILALKGNQGIFSQEVEDYFKDMLSQPAERAKLRYAENTDGGHDRVEIRRIWSTHDVDWFADKAKWSKLTGLIRVESERTLGNGEIQTESRHFITSLNNEDTAVLGQHIRSHWAVENQLHWVLDVQFGEDRSRIRKDHGPENFSLLRKMAMTMLRKETSLKKGLKAKAKKAGWDHDYLLSVLRAGLG